MTVNAKPSLRVAVIRNYVTTEQWGKDMVANIHKLVHVTIPDARVEDFANIDGGSLPSATDFDVVILTGGVYDLTIAEVEPWVADMIRWIQGAVALPNAPKLLGLCWGHQVIARALGGHVETRQDGYKMGLEEISLTAEGEAFFKGTKQLTLHKLHKRIVDRPPPGFTPLACNLEVLKSDSNKILTFQGHPEMTGPIHQAILGSGFSAYLQDPSEEGVKRAMAELEQPHTGELAWGKVMQWVRQG